MNKIILALLASLTFTCFLGAQTAQQPDGWGTVAAPYRIVNLNNLYWIAEDPARWNLIYRQTQDIDAAETSSWFGGQGWPGIGYGLTPFTGHYYGNQHTISNLQGKYGLFGNLISATVTDLEIENGSITTSAGSAALLAYSARESYISNCQVSGIVTGSGHLQGGLIGIAYPGTTIYNCGSTATVIGTAQIQPGSYSPAHSMGGLVGILESRAVLDWCYAGGQVSGNGAANVGGLVGMLSGTVSNCYSTGSLTGNGYFLGALVGRCNNLGDYTITNSYYDLDDYTINNEHQITIGALPAALFSQWLSSNRSLDINDFLTLENGRYLIQDEEDIFPLMAFGQNAGFHYRLTADLDLSSLPGYFIPLLKGDFDGGGHSIANLNISSDARTCVGFFGIVHDAVVQDLQISGCDITGGMQTGAMAGMGTYHSRFRNCQASGNIHGGNMLIIDSAVGGLIGYAVLAVVDSCQSSVNISVPGNTVYKAGGLIGMAEYSDILGSYYQGTIANLGIHVGGTSPATGGLVGYADATEIVACHTQAEVSGELRVGGLVGKNNSLITRCHSSGTVQGTNEAGGLVGLNYEDGEISKCCSDAAVSGSTQLGGLVGVTYGSIDNSYARGAVSGTNQVGGLLGAITGYYYSWGSLSKSYSTGAVSGSGAQVGGLVGSTWNSGYSGGGYWDIQTSGQSTSIVGTGRTTEQMIFPHSADTYVGWNFDSIWAPDYLHQRNDGYPYLRDTIPGSPADDPAAITLALRLGISPNPFRGNAQLRFSLPQSGDCCLEIFNLRGQKLRSFQFQGIKQGDHGVDWDGRDESGRKLSSGIYLIRARSGGESKLARAVLLR